MRLGLRTQIFIALLVTLSLSAALGGAAVFSVVESARRAQSRQSWEWLALQEVRRLSRRIQAPVPLHRRIVYRPLVAQNELNGSELLRFFPKLAATIRSAGPISGVQHRWIDEDSRRFVVALDRRGSPRQLFVSVLETRPLGKGRDRYARLIVAVYLGLVALFVGIVGYVLFNRLFVKPVDRMLSSISRLSAGVTDVPVTLDLATNLSSLNESIEQMVGELEQKHTRILDQIAHLKTVNDELARVQDSLIQSEKLASVGQLAAGVAHEIGNPLSSILGYLELLRSNSSRAEISDERADFLRRIETETQRIHRVIQNLLTYSRPADEHDPDAVCDLRETIASCIDLLKPQARYRSIDIRTTLPSPFPLVTISSGKLQQVLVNLLFNAADALHSGAREPKEIAISAELLSDARVLLCVQDNGPGIAATTLRRIFDPFFTTKEPGSGTGLGLSISHNIVTSAGGTLRAASTVGEGTTFSIELPTGGGLCGAQEA